jgi:flagellar M-ring protein FliF
MALESMLGSVVGAGKAVVKTSASLDFDETETKTQRYAAAAGVPPLTETTTRETYDGTGKGAGGVLGPDNIQVPAGGAGQYESTSEQRNNAVGLVTETRSSAPGAVRKLSVSVLLDAKTTAGIDATQVEQMVTAAVGLDVARGDTLAVTSLPFDTSTNEAAAKALAETSKADKQQELFSMAKTGAMVLAVLIVLFLAWRASRRSRRSKLTPAELAELDQMQAALEATEARAIEPADRSLALEAAPPNAEARERETRQREIAEMVSHQPDEVAQLLRGWLADRRS